MTLEVFVKEEIPKRCGVHPVYGQVAWDIFEQEQKGDKRFSAKEFKTVRDRAGLALPFKPVNEEAYEHCLDVIELCLLYHRQKYHNEDHTDRIDELFLVAAFSDEEITLADSEWWNP